MIPMLWANMFGKKLIGGGRSNIFTPLFWLIGVLVSATVSSSIFSKDVIITYVLLGVAIMLIFFTMAAWMYCLTSKDKDKQKLMQSESFNYETQVLNLLHQKTEKIEIATVDLNSIATPTRVILPENNP
jgi:predicted membrane protein